MKRYQCIKNVEMLSLVGVIGSNGQIAFRQGRTYPSVGGHHIKDEFNNTWSVNHPVLVDSLQELLDLHVDDYTDREYNTADDYAVDQDERHVYPVAAPSVSLGCAIAIAAAITAGFFIYKIITWNS